MAEAFCSEVRGLLAEYEAEEIKAIGDALLVRVPDPVQAIRLAARVVSDYGARHEALGVRVGIHTGTAVRRGGDWFGSGVNVAARVAGEAASGEVLMTAATRAAAGEGLSGDQVAARGVRRFRNVAEPLEVVALLLDEPGSRRLPVDPVCRMAVDPQRSDEHAVHRGVEYSFCSSTCREAFILDPDHFIS